MALIARTIDDTETHGIAMDVFAANAFAANAFAADALAADALAADALAADARATNNMRPMRQQPTTQRTIASDFVRELFTAPALPGPRCPLTILAHVCATALHLLHPRQRIQMRQKMLKISGRQFPHQRKRAMHKTAGV